MNFCNLQILLQESIDNSTRTIDYLYLSKAIQKMDIGQVRTVDTYSMLPEASSNTGLLVFVKADERIYWSTGTAWFNLTAENSGLVWSWGGNSAGQLGDTTLISKSSPVSVVGGFTDWAQVSAGFYHTLGVRSNGTAWGWGGNSAGQLGDGTTTCKLSPSSLAGGFTDWWKISGNRCHSLGIRFNGTLWAWGNNSCGALGNGTTINQSSPVSVVGGFTDWCQVSTGYRSTLSIRKNGTLWSWGANGSGQLGDGTTTARSSPVSVVGGFTDWCDASIGNSHSLAVRCNGAVWAWGSNSAGQLGNGTTISTSSPVSIPIFFDWCQVSVGNIFSLGVRENGTIWSWGFNNVGQLGDGTTTNRSSPVSVVGGFTDWCQVSAGIFNSVGVRLNGTAWSWGCNTSGRLGDGTVVNRSSPVQVVGGFTDWCYVSAGSAQESNGHVIGIRKTCF